MRVCLISLGCPKNQVDGETMLGLLGMAGHEVAAVPELADLVLVNTCGFIQSAQRESIGVLLDLAARKRQGLLRHLVVTGCLAQGHGADLLAELPELDAVAGTAAAGDIVALVDSLAPGSNGPGAMWVGQPGFLPQGVAPRLLTTSPWTAYLKISEGCSNRCSYCVIPDLRGPHRSRPLADIAGEARQLVAAGVRELILVGQDLTRWGSDLQGAGISGPGGRPGRSHPSLADLLPVLADIGDLRWLRLHYLHPARVDDRLLTAIASLPKVCRYLDLPVQHGDNAVLASMGRGITAGQQLALVERARAIIPGAAIRTTLIVGYPGETVARFRRMLHFLSRMAPDWTGAFAYSRQAGTPAASLTGQVPARARARRRGLAMMLARRLSLRHNRTLVGQVMEVLVETAPRQLTWVDGSERLAVSGRTYRDAPEIDGQMHISVAANRTPPRPGEFRWARVTAATAYDLYSDLPIQS